MGPPDGGESGNAPMLAVGDLVSRLRALGIRATPSLPERAVVSGIHYDSRRVSAGDLFVALPGGCTDGASFATEALTAGAVGVVCAPSARAALGESLPLLIVDDVERAAGQIAAIVFGEPARALELVGVTGTNGKTSCTYLLESVWKAAGRTPGVIGTVSQRWPGHESEAAMTTPPACDVQALLAEMRRAGCDVVAMEVSSHALAQHRVSGCSFAAAIFTNLTRDHLDYHGDEARYFAAKSRLFLEYLRENGGVAVLNADDALVMRLASQCGRRCVRTFSTLGRAGADVTVGALDADLSGMRADLCIDGTTLAIETRLVGAPNLANILAVVAVATALGVGARDIALGIAQCEPIPGRLERIGEHRPAVFVDYAHTPDALERTLGTVKTATRGRLVAVFGCGGDRDRGKRPMMGEIAGRMADVAVLTSDNPRTESPRAILDDVEAGIAGRRTKRSLAELAQGGADGYAVEPDRALAIRAAIELAGGDDVVVVAGKGHETYQEIDGVRHAFDDRAVVAELFDELGMST